MSGFDIHLKIINQTDYSFSGSYSAKYGKGLSFPKVLPQSTSDVITAKHKEVDLIVTHQTTEGAEGTFTLMCEGNFDNPEDGLIKFHVDDPQIGKNKFTLIKSSPFVELNCRFGIGKPDDRVTWGSPSLPESGHPLGIQMTITKQPVVTQLSLLTYNTHLFEGSLGETAGKAFNKLNVVAGPTRFDELVSRISQLHPDVVCLQEVWGQAMQRELVEKLHLLYPYVYIVPDEGFDLLPLDWLTHLDDWLDKITGTSGLMVASQYRILQPKFQMYTNFGKLDQDTLAKKGVLVFAITFPVSATQTATLNIGVTHCPGGFQQGLKALQTAADLALGKDSDSLLVGDFNIHFTKPAELEALNKIMAAHGARDLIDDQIELLDEYYTEWAWGNAVSIALNIHPNINSKERLDYIYYSPGSKPIHLMKESVTVFHDWKAHGIFDVSDHYPVFVKLIVT